MADFVFATKMNAQNVEMFVEIHECYCFVLHLLGSDEGLGFRWIPGSPDYSRRVYSARGSAVYFLTFKFSRAFPRLTASA